MHWKVKVGLIGILITSLLCTVVLLFTFFPDFRESRNTEEKTLHKKEKVSSQTGDILSEEESTEASQSLSSEIEAETVSELPEEAPVMEEIVLAASLIPEEIPEEAVVEISEEDARASLVICQDPSLYTYENMMADGDLLLRTYPELLSDEVMGTTLDGRAFRVFRIGSRQAERKILLNAGIHAREYITCQLLMKQMAEFLHELRQGSEYKGHALSALLENTAIYVVPMVNPDGTSISQFGMDGVQTQVARDRLGEIAAADGASLSDSYYLTRWKANANGVDLNRNFDALWESYQGAGHISSDHYKGTSIGCETESAALIELTEREQFDRTISYHTQGSVIYWYFAQQEPLYSKSLRFAERMRNLTGYGLDANYEALDPAGYKDWGIMKLQIPGLTIEVGSETSPVPSYQFPDIWRRNQYVWQETLLDLIENP